MMDKMAVIILRWLIVFISDIKMDPRKNHARTTLFSQLYQGYNGQYGEIAKTIWISTFSLLFMS